MVADRDPAQQEGVRRTGLFLLAVIVTLFTSSMGFMLWRWYTR